MALFEWVLLDNLLLCVYFNLKTIFLSTFDAPAVRNIHIWPFPNRRQPTLEATTRGFSQQAAEK